MRISVQSGYLRIILLVDFLVDAFQRVVMESRLFFCVLRKYWHVSRCDDSLHGRVGFGRRSRSRTYRSCRT